MVRELLDRETDSAKKVHSDEVTLDERLRHQRHEVR
jgi:hypothetical protein